MKERNANLDVLRCLAMFVIVLGHAYCHGPYAGTNPWLRVVFFNLICWHVDVFTSLSGWFGIKLHARKFCRLWGVIAFYSVVSVVIGRCLMGVPTPFRVHGGWYGDAYLCLMLVAPIINAATDSLLKQGMRVAWSAWCGGAVIMLVNWLSGNSYISLIAWGVGPFTLVHLMFVYLTVRLFRLTNLADRVRLWHIGVVALVFLGAALFLRGERTNYVAPYTIAMALAMLVLFEKFLNFPKWTQSLAAKIAPAMFGVYLLHGATSFGAKFFCVPMGMLSSRFSLSPWLVIVVGAVFCWCLCTSLEILRQFCWSGIQKWYRCIL